MSCGISSPKQLFRVKQRRKGPMLPNGLQTLGGTGSLSLRILAQSQQPAWVVTFDMPYTKLT